ncbi:MAG TPA: M24 family metallopeptidase [Myxococcota bacterium]|nr:M24 family metallopeptidase [Myxococcota bacterium]HNH47622.1 M24 family metallopeptidase [Myxococcota bacterium]
MTQLPPALPPEIAAFDEAQRRTVGLMRAVAAALAPGMRAGDVVRLAKELAPKEGFSGWFHEPVVRIGAAIGQDPLRARLDRGELQPGTLVNIDLGPATQEAYGDLGTTLCLPGAPEPEGLPMVRELAKGCTGYCSRWKTMGEIFIFAEAWCRNRGMLLLDKDSVGHRILPLEGWHRQPALARLALRWRPYRLHRLNFRRMDGIFSINPTAQVGEISASFEEVVYIHEEVRRVLGRNSLDEVGTL